MIKDFSSGRFPETRLLFFGPAQIYHIMHCHWKKSNCGAGLGLKIPVMYQARRHEKALQWLEKAIKKILLQVDNLVSKFKSK